jgi:hypothetical protein
MMTPDQITLLHDMNETMSRLIMQTRQDQTRVTQLLAVAKKEHDYPNTDQHHFENMLALAQIDHHTMVYRTEEIDSTTVALNDRDIEVGGELSYPTGRVDVCITTGPLQSTAGDEPWVGEYINVEFQFDNGRFVAMKTLLGPRVDG